jgi:hypothetical protein
MTDKKNLISGQNNLSSLTSNAYKSKTGIKISKPKFG